MPHYVSDGQKHKFMLACCGFIIAAGFITAWFLIVLDNVSATSAFIETQCIIHNKSVVKCDGSSDYEAQWNASYNLQIKDGKPASGNEGTLTEIVTNCTYEYHVDKKNNCEKQSSAEKHLEKPTLSTDKKDFKTCLVHQDNAEQCVFGVPFTDNSILWTVLAGIGVLVGCILVTLGIFRAD